jgi:HB1, ASXL, restriction endonuclease HTH domain
MQANSAQLRRIESGELPMTPIVAKLQAEIDSKKAMRDAINTEIVELETALKVVDKAGLDDLETALKVLKRLADDEDDDEEEDDRRQPDNKAPEKRGFIPPKPATSELAGKTIMEAAMMVLSEHPRRPMHFREIATDAIRRGYQSGRDTDGETVITSFGQTLRREAYREGNPIVAHGGGRFSYLPPPEKKENSQHDATQSEETPQESSAKMPKLFD